MSNNNLIKRWVDFIMKSYLTKTYAREMFLVSFGLALVVVALLNILGDSIKYRLNKFLELCVSIPLTDWLIVIGMLFMIIGLILYILKRFKPRVIENE